MSKRLADDEPVYVSALDDIALPVEADDVDEFTIERRAMWGGSRNRPTSRWSGGRRVTPYYKFHDGTNYKSARPVANVKIFPGSWFGRGWYRMLSAPDPATSYVKREYDNYLRDLYRR